VKESFINYTNTSNIV